jgi:hypothetical protein
VPRSVYVLKKKSVMIKKPSIREGNLYITTIKKIHAN